MVTVILVLIVAVFAVLAVNAINNENEFQKGVDKAFCEWDHSASNC